MKPYRSKERILLLQSPCTLRCVDFEGLLWVRRAIERIKRMAKVKACFPRLSGVAFDRTALLRSEVTLDLHACCVEWVDGWIVDV